MQPLKRLENKLEKIKQKVMETDRKMTAMAKVIEKYI